MERYVDIGVTSATLCSVSLQDPDEGPPPEELLLRHMDRWKRIRNT